MFQILTQSPIPCLFVMVAFLFGYLSGSVPYGLLLGKMAGIGDIRKIGSGNIGATNVLRAGSKKLAIITLLLDGLKGVIPVLIARHYHMDYAVMAALGAFIGHLFPVWLKFKGGKGVAVALGIAFVLSWKVGIVLCLIWLVTVMIGKYSSLSALAAFALAPIVAWYITFDFQIVFVMSFLTIVIWVKHHDNIRRLLNGTESKINLRKKTSQ